MFVTKLLTLLEYIIVNAFQVPHGRRLFHVPRARFTLTPMEPNRKTAYRAHTATIASKAVNFPGNAWQGRLPMQLISNRRIALVRAFQNATYAPGVTFVKKEPLIRFRVVRASSRTMENLSVSQKKTNAL
jgi:hypothetical protein